MPILLALALAAVQTAPRSDAVVPPGGQVDAAAADGGVIATQIAPARAGDAVDQLSAADPNRRAVPQVSRSTPEDRAPQPQITRERPGVGGAPQLGTGTRSAAAPQSSSTRADGRRTEIVRVGGSDRCDPQAASAGETRCTRVIETRSAEFTSPRAPVLSPEQRLLLDQERGEARGVRAAAQRVARNDVDPNALDTQALAAISLGQPTDPTPPVAVDPAVPAGTEAVIQLIEAIQSAGPKL